MYYKKFVKSVLCLVALPWFFLLTAIVIIDPLQVFHKSWFHPGKYYFKSPREASYGIIKYADYDSIIIGSSAVNNFSANEASKKIGGKFINMAIDGSTLFERKILLKHSLNSRKAKLVIFSFDELIDIGFINNYDRLYGFFWSKLSFYFNEELKTLLKNSVLQKQDLVCNLDHPGAWYDSPEQKCRFGGFGNWIHAALNKNLQAKASLKCIIDAVKSQTTGSPRALPTQKVPNSILKCIDEYFDMIKQYSNTLFLLFLPPYSKMYWKTEMLLSNEFETYLVVVKYLLSKFKDCDNVLVYGFDNESFTKDIKRYKDRVHYDKKINSFILDCIRDGTHLLTLDNIDQYLHQLESESTDYDLQSFYDQIKNLEGLS
jgi:hypothetical protein